MAELSLVYIPDEVLKQTAQEVPVVDAEIQDMLNCMVDVMNKHNGIGLAGNQVGLLKRLVVIDCPISEDEEESESVQLKMVNPVITKSSDTMKIREEGCLSIPTGKGEIERPDGVSVEYLDENGDKQTLDADGLLATCIQHEIDHLNGVLYIDYLSKLKKDMIKKKVKKYLKEIS